MEDETIRRLSKKIFPNIWARHKLMPSIQSSCNVPVSEVAYFSEEVGNAVMVYLHVYRPALSKHLEKLIPFMPQSKMQFYIHVAFLCLQARLTKDNVFDYFLTSCSITAEVALHCYVNGYEDVLPLASLFFCAFFENELQGGFHQAGGWLELHRYIQKTGCQVLYDEIDSYIKELSSPSEPLPILIRKQNEELAAERRENFISLLSFKISEIERDDQTKSLVSGILHWDFMENERISEAKPGVLKRMENIRHKKNKLDLSVTEENSSESLKADEALHADNKVFDNDKLLTSHDAVHKTNYVDTMLEPGFDDEERRMLNEFRCPKLMTRNENQSFSSNETSQNTEFCTSPSLSELCNFYENLSSSEGKKDLKRFKSKNKKCHEIEYSTSDETIGCKKSDDFKRLVPYSYEEDESFLKSKYFRSESVEGPTESFHVNVLPEIKKSFEESGFTCFSVGDSNSFDKNSASIANHEEIMKKCSYFQNKYPSMQFAILVPNSITVDKASQTPIIEKSNICFEKEYDGQQFSTITQKDFTNSSVQSQPCNSQTKKTRFTVTKVDENQLKSTIAFPLSQNSVTEKTQKSRFTVTKVENFLSGAKTLEIEENYKNATTKISRFTVTRIDEKQSDGGTGLIQKKLNETTKISRFTVTKINENQPLSRTGILQNKLTNEATKISRFTVTKVNETLPELGTSILRQNWTNEVDKISTINSTFDLSDDTEYETVHFQDKDRVMYQKKRVSFSEHTLISYYQRYSSDESQNSRTSGDSFNKNSQGSSTRNSEQNANQESTSRSSTISERRRFFQWFPFHRSQSSSNNAGGSNMSCRTIFNRMFRRSSCCNRKTNESSKEGTRDKQKIEELETSLEAVGVESPVVFKV